MRRINNRSPGGGAGYKIPETLSACPSPANASATSCRRGIAEHSGKADVFTHPGRAPAITTIRARAAVHAAHGNANSTARHGQPRARQTKAPLSRAFTMAAIRVFTLARRAKIAQLEVNRDASPHIERAWGRQHLVHSDEPRAARRASDFLIPARRAAKHRLFAATRK